MQVYNMDWYKAFFLTTDKRLEWTNRFTNQTDAIEHAKSRLGNGEIVKIYDSLGTVIFDSEQEAQCTKDRIRKGDRVTIRPEWRDAGDERFTWVARNDEENGRLDISALEFSSLPIWPMQTVTINMIVREVIERIDAQEAQ